MTPSKNTVETTAETSMGLDVQHGVRTLTDGGMIAGHVGEEAVVLVRRGDEFFALDAVCTHYGGPLADGALVNGSATAWCDVGCPSAGAAGYPGTVALRSDEPMDDDE